MLRSQMCALVLFVLSVTSCRTKDVSNELLHLIPNNSTQVTVYKTRSLEAILMKDPLAMNELADLWKVKCGDLPKNFKVLGIDKEQDIFAFQCPDKNNGQLLHVILMGLSDRKQCLKACSSLLGTVQWTRLGAVSMASYNNQVMVVAEHYAYLISRDSSEAMEVSLASLYSDLIQNSSGSILQNVSFLKFLPQVRDMGVFINAGNALLSSPISSFTAAKNGTIWALITMDNKLIHCNVHYEPSGSELPANNASKVLHKQFELDGLAYLPANPLLMLSISLDPRSAFNLELESLLGKDAKGIQNAKNTIDFMLSLQGTNSENLLAALNGNVLVLYDSMPSNGLGNAAGNALLMFGLNKGETVPDLSSLFMLSPMNPVQMWVQGEVLYVSSNEAMTQAIQGRKLISNPLASSPAYAAMKSHAVYGEINISKLAWVQSSIPWVTSLTGGTALNEVISSINFSTNDRNNVKINLIPLPNKSASEAFIGLAGCLP